MKRNSGQEKLLNVNSLSSKKLVMEISVRRIRQPAQDNSASATAEGAVAHSGVGRGDRDPARGGEGSPGGRLAALWDGFWLCGRYWSTGGAGATASVAGGCARSWPGSQPPLSEFLGIVRTKEWCEPSGSLSYLQMMINEGYQASRFKILSIR